MTLTTPEATIPVAVLLDGYAKGRFPMAHDDGQLYWHDPDPRAVFDLTSLVPDARTARHLRSGRFSITINKVFADVIQHCADRRETWIDERMRVSYIALHHAGHAHSVETWDNGRLVGGIYGVALGGAFFGESMFASVNNAGKVAFHSLVQHLRERGFMLFDTQYLNPFSASLGAMEVPRRAFRLALKKAFTVHPQF